jgi:hypothetical protein
MILTVVADQMDVQAGRYLFVERDQERFELGGPMVAVQGADHFAGGDLERGEQGGGAVSKAPIKR